MYKPFWLNSYTTKTLDILQPLIATAQSPRGISSQNIQHVSRPRELFPRPPPFLPPLPLSLINPPPPLPINHPLLVPLCQHLAPHPFPPMAFLIRIQEGRRPARPVLNDGIRRRKRILHRRSNHPRRARLDPPGAVQARETTVRHLRSRGPLLVLHAAVAVVADDSAALVKGDVDV